MTKVLFKVSGWESVDVPDSIKSNVIEKVKSGEFRTSQEVFDYCESQGDECKVTIDDNSIVTLSVGSVINDHTIRIEKDQDIDNPIWTNQEAPLEKAPTLDKSDLIEEEVKVNSSNNNELISALEAFEKAVTELSLQWEIRGSFDLPGNADYPFNQSFDELACEVGRWSEECIEGLREENKETT